MNAVDVLRGIRSKLAQGWTRGASARNAEGAAVIPVAIDACAWCIYGAACAVGACLDERLAAYRYLRRFTNGATADAFNDLPDQTQVSVLCWVDRAIQAAELEAA